MRLLTAFVFSLMLGVSFAAGAVADGKTSSQPASSSTPETSSTPLDDYLGGCSQPKPIS
ncbi:MAG: hypothetical protein ACFE0S_08365 [Rhodospirillales bacterium]